MRIGSIKKGSADRVYRTAGWALCDQAILSGGNFLTSLVLIRTLAPSSYGAYALVIIAVQFLNGLHASMVAYPVCMRGAWSDDETLRGVATSGLMATLAGVVVNAGLITVACLSIRRLALVPVAIAAALFWQLQETLRTVFISRVAYKRALAGDAVSYLGQTALVAAICWRHVPSLFLVFLIILSTSMLGGVLQAIQILPKRPDREFLRSFFRELWRLGKWSTLAKVVAFFTFQAFPWLLAYTSGLSAVASFQSLSQLVAGANPLLFSFNTLIITSVANCSNNSGASSWRAAVKQMWLAAVLLGFYFVVLAVYGPLFMKAIYGPHSPYLRDAHLLRYFALAYVLETASMLAGAILGGLGETRFTFISQVASMATSVLVVFPWVVISGLKAAVIGLIFVAGTRAAVGWCLAIYALKRRNKTPRYDPDFVKGGVSHLEFGERGR